MIPAEAVEAAAKMSHYIETGKQWETLAPERQRELLSKTYSILEAAAPYMQEELERQGPEDAKQEERSSLIEALLDRARPVIPAEAAEAAVPWDELRPYEQQQGGYWAYPKNAGVYGEGKVFVRVARPAK